MSPWLFNVYMKQVMKDVKVGMGRKGVRFLEAGRERKLPGLLYADDLVLRGKLEEDLRAMVGLFDGDCKGGEVKIKSAFHWFFLIYFKMKQRKLFTQSPPPADYS